MRDATERQRLDGKVAIITGATCGIGEATASLFLHLGAKVMLVGRFADKLAATRARLEAHGDVTTDWRGLPVMPNTDATKAGLEAQLAELKERQDRIAQDMAEPLDADSSERAVEMEDDASLEGQAVMLSREIASVHRALLRVEVGTYGECVRCGADIDPRRLEVRPEAALCISCANQEQ